MRASTARVRVRASLCQCPLRATPLYHAYRCTTIAVWGKGMDSHATRVHPTCAPTCDSPWTPPCFPRWCITPRATLGLSHLVAVTAIWNHDGRDNSSSRTLTYVLQAGCTNQYFNSEEAPQSFSDLKIGACRNRETHRVLMTPLVLDLTRLAGSETPQESPLLVPRGYAIP